MEHSFTKIIKQLLRETCKSNVELVYKNSQLLQYINKKTKSANKGSKSRGSFANLYALYVLIEDYVNKDFHNNGDYRNYEGAIFSSLFKRQRELPFGARLQNHALNHRLNQEFKKYNPELEYDPIVRDVKTNRYWINENLLKVNYGKEQVNIAQTIIRIIDSYIKAKKDSFEKFIKTCQSLRDLENKKIPKTKDFVLDLLNPNVDARIFEIVSYSILKYYYFDQIVYFGFQIEELKKENLKLFKTGRTNANDGGIDFVMKPIGRFFQVTETTDIKKYFLDIDKLEKFPITFVIKSKEKKEALLVKIKENAERQYPIAAVIERYMQCVEELINIEELIERFNQSVALGYLDDILNEVIFQSKIEFNYEEENNENTKE